MHDDARSGDLSGARPASRTRRALPLLRERRDCLGLPVRVPGGPALAVQPSVTGWGDPNGKSVSCARGKPPSNSAMSALSSKYVCQSSSAHPFPPWRSKAMISAFMSRRRSISESARRSAPVTTKSTPSTSTTTPRPRSSTRVACALIAEELAFEPPRSFHPDLPALTRRGGLNSPPRHKPQNCWGFWHFSTRHALLVWRLQKSYFRLVSLGMWRRGELKEGE
jgi:hypothetical protein